MIAEASSVGIVLVNYNGHRFLNGCLRALYAGTVTDFELILVDNASTDGSAEEACREFPSVTLLRQRSNLGVAGGNNVGIAYCRERAHRFVLLMNYDTLPDARMLEELLAVAVPGVLVSGYTLVWDDSGRSNSHAGALDWTLGRLREPFFGGVMEALRATREIDNADTCCLLVPREVFDAIGVMDAAYFMYYDDTDFIVRARRAGFRCVLNPAARLRHYERGASGPVSLSPISVYYSNRNRPYFMGKHAPSWPRYAVFVLYFSVTRAANLLKWIATGDFQRPAWMLRGLADFARGRMGPMNGTVVHGTGTGA